MSSSAKTEQECCWMLQVHARPGPPVRRQGPAPQLTQLGLPQPVDRASVSLAAICPVPISTTAPSNRRTPMQTPPCANDRSLASVGGQATKQEELNRSGSETFKPRAKLSEFPPTRSSSTPGGPPVPVPCGPAKRSPPLAYRDLGQRLECTHDDRYSNAQAHCRSCQLPSC